MCFINVILLLLGRPLRLLTASTKRRERRTFWCLTSVAGHLMWLCWLLTMACSRSCQPMETHILVSGWQSHPGFRYMHPYTKFYWENPSKKSQPKLYPVLVYCSTSDEIFRLNLWICNFLDVYFNYLKRTVSSSMHSNSLKVIKTPELIKLHLCRNPGFNRLKKPKTQWNQPVWVF